VHVFIQPLVSSPFDKKPNSPFVFPYPGPSWDFFCFFFDVLPVFAAAIRLLTYGGFLAPVNPLFAYFPRYRSPSFSPFFFFRALCFSLLEYGYPSFYYSRPHWVSFVTLRYAVVHAFWVFDFFFLLIFSVFLVTSVTFLFFVLFFSFSSGFGDFFDYPTSLIFVLHTILLFCCLWLSDLVSGFPFSDRSHPPVCFSIPLFLSPLLLMFFIVTTIVPSQ